MQFFTLIVLMFFLASLIFGYPVLLIYFETRPVAFLSFTAGVVLNRNEGSP